MGRYSYKRPEFACSEYTCRNEAKWEPEGLDERIKALQEFDKQYDRNHPRTYGEIASGLVRCGVHGPGPEKRKHWGTTQNYVPLRPTTISVVLEFRKQREIEQRKADEEKAEQERVRQQDNATHYWKELDEEPDYVLVEEDEKRWSGSARKKFVIYNAKAYAERQAQGESDRYLHREAEVMVGEDSNPEHGIIRPSYLKNSISSNLTPRLARMWAEAMIRAADAVEAKNVELREQHAKVEAERVNA